MRLCQQLLDTTSEVIDVCHCWWDDGLGVSCLVCSMLDPAWGLTGFFKMKYSNLNVLL